MEHCTGDENEVGKKELGVPSSHPMVMGTASQLLSETMDHTLY